MSEISNKESTEKNMLKNIMIGLIVALVEGGIIGIAVNDMRIVVVSVIVGVTVGMINSLQKQL